MTFPKKLGQLCSPALLYFSISMIVVVMTIFQNLGNNRMYRVANYSCMVPNTMLVFAVKIIYILFWTWILNLMCKDGYSNIAWFLVLLPFILMFILIALLMMNGRNKKDKKEGVRNRSHVGSEGMCTSCGCGAN
jgi:hypothetical protein